MILDYPDETPVVKFVDYESATVVSVECEEDMKRSSDSESSSSYTSSVYSSSATTLEKAIKDAIPAAKLVDDESARVISVECQEEISSSSTSSVYSSLAGNDSPLKDENFSGNDLENVSWSGTKMRNNLQGDGSGRREKEWKRTLACMLYEERMTSKFCEERKVAEGCYEMDLLWEAYEFDALKIDKNDCKMKKKEENNIVIEEEHDEDGAAEVCCLQALRLSAGKMNLGVGRSNLIKISKALTGVGLLKRIGSRRSRRV